jgi:hypothetical protein
MDYIIRNVEGEIIFQGTVEEAQAFEDKLSVSP